MVNFQEEEAHCDQGLCMNRASLVAQMVKNLPANAGATRDVGLIPGLGISLGEGNGSPLQYFCLENPRHRSLQSVGWQRVRHD